MQLMLKGKFIAFSAYASKKERQNQLSMYVSKGKERKTSVESSKVEGKINI